MDSDWHRDGVAAVGPVVDPAQDGSRSSMGHMVAVAVGLLVGGEVAAHQAAAW